MICLGKYFEATFLRRLFVLDKSISKSSGKESTYSTNLWSRKGTLASTADCITSLSILISKSSGSLIFKSIKVIHLEIFEFLLEK